MIQTEQLLSINFFYYLGTISSEQTPNISEELLSLISVTTPRRTKWSYHFNDGNGKWFDITLNLPYHILLHEVQIRTHVPALNSEFASFLFFESCRSFELIF